VARFFFRSVFHLNADGARRQNDSVLRVDCRTTNRSTYTLMKLKRRILKAKRAHVNAQLRKPRIRSSHRATELLAVVRASSLHALAPVALQCHANRNAQYGDDTRYLEVVQEFTADLCLKLSLNKLIHVSDKPCCRQLSRHTKNNRERNRCVFHMKFAAPSDTSNFSITGMS
jgi:hypothetical protein